MKCSKCGKQYDTTSWQALRLCSVGATGSENVATSIIENRICTCGGSVSVRRPCKHCGDIGGGAAEQDTSDKECAAVVVFMRGEASLARSRASTMQAAEAGRVWCKIAEALDRVANRIRCGEHRGGSLE